MKHERKHWVWPFFCGVGLTAALGFVMASLNRPMHGSPTIPPPAALSQTLDGPWGRLDALPIPFVNPGHMVPETELLDAPKWFFENFSESELVQLLSSCQLTETQRLTLLDKRIWDSATNGYIISPPPFLVSSLSREARGTLYSALARSPTNHFQRYPFRFSRSFLAHGARAFGVSTQAVAAIQTLTYTDTQGTCFADLEAAREELSPRDFRLLVETLYEVPAYLLRLRIVSTTDVDALVEYWGVGGRTNLIRPLLTALSRVPQGGSINVSYLLPPFARLRLYTYPAEWKDAARDTANHPQECFFTALNFFNTEPDTNSITPEYIRKVLDTEYSPVSSPLYGDLILLFEDAGTMIHACVYVAADFVFTKNGMGTLQPWIVMKKDDMLRLYPTANPAKTQIMRRNGLRSPERARHLLTSVNADSKVGENQ